MARVEAIIRIGGEPDKTVRYDSDNGGSLSAKEKAAIRKGIEALKLDPSKTITKIIPDAQDGGPVDPKEILAARAVAAPGAPSAKSVVKNPGVALFRVTELNGKPLAAGESFEVPDATDDDKLDAVEEAGFTQKIEEAHPELKGKVYTYKYTPVGATGPTGTAVKREVAESGEIGPAPKLLNVTVNIDRAGTPKEKKGKPPTAPVAFRFRGGPNGEMTQPDAKDFIDMWEQDPSAKDALRSSKVNIEGKPYTLADIYAKREQPIYAPGSPEELAAAALADTMQTSLADLKRRAKKDRDFAFELLRMLAFMGISDKTVKFIVQAFAYLTNVSLTQASGMLIDRLHKTTTKEKELIAQMERAGAKSEQASTLYLKIQSEGRDIHMFSNTSHDLSEEMKRQLQLAKSFFDQDSNDAGLFAWR